MRTSVVYRHPLICELAVSVLRSAGIDVSAVIPSRDLTFEILQELQPDIVVIDRAAQQELEGVTQASFFFRPQTKGICRIITLGFDDPTMVVCDRQLVENATIQNLVEAVRGNPESVDGFSNAGRTLRLLKPSRNGSIETLPIRGEAR
jgi:hypothetical protein